MDDYEFVFNLRQRKRPQRKTILPKSDPFIVFDDYKFKKRFRMSKKTFHVLHNLVKNDLIVIGNRDNPISSKRQLLIALRFYATGSFQIVSGDLIGSSQPTISRIVLRVSTVIAKYRSRFIVFPSHSEESKVNKFSLAYIYPLFKLNSGFSKIAGFPGVIGVVDGTHIKVKVKKELHERFRNRKNEITLNCQVVFDHTMKFIHLNARWPGITHDSRVFKDSEPFYILESDERYEGHLLGDSAYPCKKYLLTPLSNPSTLAEMIYQKHIKTRNLVERSIGAWKRRFYCLNDLRLKFSTSLVVIVAVAVLWNFLIDEKDEMDDEEKDIVENCEQIFASKGGTQAGFTKRKEIIDYFCSTRSSVTVSTRSVSSALSNE
ncbi:putative nuclease HARBI1 [Panonychus citri]|uniref:putative nuclease HARBI1 n=1 Tax=Panonychus citri TaxID=50023 RepID=UPI002306F713|nr:putative nuclease HARBI1 [Panonychus citri]